jgi:hypothetical protein
VFTRNFSSIHRFFASGRPSQKWVLDEKLDFREDPLEPKKLCIELKISVKTHYYCPSKKRITHSHFLDNSTKTRAREVRFSDMERAVAGASFCKQNLFQKVLSKPFFYRISGKLMDFEKVSDNVLLIFLHQ